MAEKTFPAFEAGKGYDVYCIVKKVEEKTTKSGNKYVTMGLANKSKEVSANCWNTSLATAPTVGSVINAYLKVSTYNGNLSFEVSAWKAIGVGDNITAEELTSGSPESLDSMMNEVLQTIGEMKDEMIKAVVGNIISANAAEFARHGAAQSMHHDFIGGLLYHTTRMLRSAKALAPIYPTVNRDVLYGAVILHDIGKLKELSTNEVGISEYTIDGSLYGHLFIGGQMIMEKVYSLGIDMNHAPAIKDLLHCVLSHHGEQEWGAIVVPQTLEAMMLHELDMIDSRAMQYETACADLKSGEQTSQKNFALGNVKLYKA